MFHHPPTLHRPFFALRPPPALARQVAQAATWFGAARDALPPERLHLTMFILDDRVELAPTLVDALLGMGEAVRAAPIAVTLDVASGSERSIALRPAHRNAGLTALYRQLVGLARKAGVAERESYRFGAHMTLGYRRGSSFTQAIAPIGWEADELMLIDSHVGRTRHEVLGRWALGSEEAQLSLL